MRPFLALIFDLDDTLFDTYGQVTKQALPAAFEAMIAHGLPTTVTDCLKLRREFIHSRSRLEFFDALVSFLAPNQPQLAQLGLEKYLSFLAQTEIFIPPRVHEMLRNLQLYHSQFLVTAGNPERQNNKIDRLKIRSYFEHVYCVDTRTGATKRDNFFKIAQALHTSSERVLCIGNRIDLELCEAKDLGFKTCLVRTGEYRDLVPNSWREEPDFVINSVEEVAELCKNQ